MGSFFVRIYDFFERRRALLWALLALIVAAMAAGTLRVRYDEQITGVFRAGESGRKQAMIFDNLKMMDKIAVLFTSPDPDRTIACAEVFEEHLRQSPGAEQIAEITAGVGEDKLTEGIEVVYGNLPQQMTEADYARIDSLMAGDGVEHSVRDAHSRLSSPLGMAVGGVVMQDPLGMAAGKLAGMERFGSMMDYELYDGRIFSKDLATMLMVIEPRRGIGDTGANELLVEDIENSQRAAQAEFGDVQIEYVGGPSVAVHNARQVKADTWLTLSIALLVTVLFIFSAFRNRFAVLLVVAPVIFGALFALCAIWLMGRHTMSAIAIGAGAAVLGVALSYSIHVVSHANHTADPRQIIRELAMPLTVGSITTIGSFLGLLFTGSPLLRDLGLFAALTLVGTTIFCLIFLPHLLTQRSGAVGWMGRVVDRIGSYRYDRNKPLIFGLTALTVVCLFFAGRVGFDSDMTNLSWMPPHLKAAEQRLDSLSGGARRPVLFVAVGSDRESAHTAQLGLEKRLDSLQSAGLVQGWVSASDLLPPPSVQRERIARWNEFWGGGRREQLLERISNEAVMAGFREGAFNGFAWNLEKNYAVTENVPPMLADWVGTADDGSRMLVSQVRIGESRKEQVYARFAGQNDVVIVDRSYFAGRMARGVSDDFNLALLLASSLIFVALLICYGRIELTLMSFMPMMVSWVIILGVMAMLGIEFNIVSIILSTFIFGIGDDFSIFIMDGLQAEYARGRRMLAAHKTAIFFSAFTILVGLGVMVLAKHPAMHSLAVVSVLGIVTVIVVSYSIQPVLFRLLVSKPAARGGFPVTLAAMANSLWVFGVFVTGCGVLQGVIGVLWPLPIGRARKQLLFHKSVRWAVRALLWLTPTVRRIFSNVGETFKEPSVVIANHQSFADILVLLSLHPKLVMVTNSWVWNSPFFGRIVRHAGFYHTAGGYDDIVGSLAEKVKEGYSVVVFPEGTRSADMQIGRFHKGAFYLAERLGLDVVPVVLYGTGLAVSKRQPLYIKKSVLVAKILPRITLHDARFAPGYAARTKEVGRWFREEYRTVYEDFNRASNPYFFDALMKSYTFKGPVLEWYMRVKVRMECGYDLFDRLVPRAGTVVDIGCGYGALAHTLAMLSDRRTVVGIDYDADKIEVAEHSFLTNSRTRFFAADALEAELPRADAFILSDMLHYLPFEQQDALLARCFAHLNPGGVVVIRDGDASDAKRHKTTLRTERWSTHLIKFNKTNGELHFTDHEKIAKAAAAHGFGVRVVSEGHATSNKVYLCTKL